MTTKVFSESSTDTIKVKIDRDDYATGLLRDTTAFNHFESLVCQQATMAQEQSILPGNSPDESHKFLQQSAEILLYGMERCLHVPGINGNTLLPVRCLKSYLSQFHDEAGIQNLATLLVLKNEVILKRWRTEVIQSAFTVLPSIESANFLFFVMKITWEESLLAAATAYSSKNRSTAVSIFLKHGEPEKQEMLQKEMLSRTRGTMFNEANEAWVESAINEARKLRSQTNLRENLTEAPASSSSDL